jgi:protein-S-isoprenylcysteine O-methyltransferase Ste14
MTGWPAFAVFTAVVAVRHLAQLLYRNRREKGAETSGLPTTSLLFICYVSIWITLSVLMVLGMPMGALFFSGAAVFVVGVALRLVSIVTLGAFYSEAIEIRGDHKLVRHGVYSLVRHPLHLAFFVELLGMALMAQTLWLIPPMVLLTVTIAVRNRTEDGKLSEKFGEEFREYSARVPAVNIFRGVIRRLLGRKQLDKPESPV